MYGVSVPVEQDWETLAQDILVDIRRANALKKKEHAFVQTSRVPSPGSRLPEGVRGDDATKDGEDAEGPFLTLSSGALPPAWLFSMYFAQNLVKRYVVSDATNSLMLVEACAKASVVLILVSCIADCLIYQFQRQAGTNDPLAAPWQVHNLFATVAIGIGAFLTNFGCMSYFNARTSLLVGFFCLVLVSRTVIKLQEAISNVDALGVWKHVAAMCFLGPRVWSECGCNVPHDMCCPISQAPFVEPVVLQDMVFENDYVRKWIHDNGTHPIDRNRLVSCSDLKPCPAMKTLVARYAWRHGMRKIVRQSIM